MLLHAGGNGQDVRVEDDVVGVEADLLGEDAVGPRTDLHLVWGGGGERVGALYLSIYFYLFISWEVCP